MKTNRIICIMLCFVLLAFTACRAADQQVDNICEAHSSNDYQIYFTSQGSSEYPLCENTVHINNIYPKLTKPEPAHMRTTITINGINYELNYNSSVESRKDAYAHVYETSDKKVICLYWAEDMRLARVLIDLDLAEFSNMDQQQYEQWIHAFVSQFTEYDFQNLPMSCRTQYNGLTVDGFSNELIEGKNILEYEFVYSKYIGSLLTSDCVKIRFRIESEENTMQVTVSLNRHDFDTVDTLVLDEAAIEAAINAYISEHALEVVEIESWETVGEDELFVVGNNIMLYRTIDVLYKWKEINTNGSYRIAIDIPDP